MGRNYATPGMGTYGATWVANGYSGQGNVEPLIGTLRGQAAVVCGSGETVFEEFEELRKRFDYDQLVVFGVNDVGMYLPRLDHWVSLHDDRLAVWRAVRWLHAPGGAEHVKYHGIDPRLLDKGELTYCWNQINPMFALSGYFAMQIAWIMQACPIILCGCPGDVTSRFFEASGRRFGYGSGETQSDKGVREQVVNEMNRLPDFKATVRSTSGWTREFFGGV